MFAIYFHFPCYIASTFYILHMVWYDQHLDEEKIVRKEIFVDMWRGWFPGGSEETFQSISGLHLYQFIFQTVNSYCSSILFRPGVGSSPPWRLRSSLIQHRLTLGSGDSINRWWKEGRIWMDIFIKNFPFQKLCFFQTMLGKKGQECHFMGKVPNT